MKRLITVMAIAATLAACNDTGNSAANTKDSLDSVASEKKDMVDSTADNRKDMIDSTTEAKKDMVDSLHNGDSTKK